ncbi:hypothetical protein CXF41_10580, partial [Corynebacterium bovis]
MTAGPAPLAQRPRPRPQAGETELGDGRRQELRHLVRPRVGHPVGRRADRVIRVRRPEVPDPGGVVRRHGLRVRDTDEPPEVVRRPALESDPGGPGDRRPADLRRGDDRAADLRGTRVSVRTGTVEDRHPRREVVPPPGRLLRRGVPGVLRRPRREGPVPQERPLGVEAVPGDRARDLTHPFGEVDVLPRRLRRGRGVVGVTARHARRVVGVARLAHRRVRGVGRAGGVLGGLRRRPPDLVDQRPDPADDPVDLPGRRPRPTGRRPGPRGPG